MGLKYERVAFIASVLVVIVLSTQIPGWLTASQRRQLLAENPLKNLILVSPESFEQNRAELLGRSINPEIEFVRWNYEDEILRGYIGNVDKVFTYEPRVLQGNTLLYKNRSSFKDLKASYSDDFAQIIEVFSVYNPSNKSVRADVKIIYDIYPFTTKPRMIIENATVNNLRFQVFIWLHNHDDGERIDLDYGGNTNYSYDDVGLDWLDDVIPTSVYKFGNGKVQLNYPSGEYDIDPTIIVGGVTVNYKLIKKISSFYSDKIGKHYRSGVVSGDIPLALKFNKDLTFSADKFSSLLKYSKKTLSLNLTSLIIEVGVNKSVIKRIFDKNVFYNVTKFINGSFVNITRKNVTYKNVSDWFFDWEELDLSKSYDLKADKWYVINFHGTWNASTKDRSVDLVPLINTYSFSEYAWWNISYDWYATIQNSTGDLYGISNLSYGYGYASSGNNHYLYVDTDSVYGKEVIRTHTTVYCYFNTSSFYSSCSKVPNTLVGYWPFDEGAGNTTAWDPARGYNATVNNNPTFGVSGKVNTAINFTNSGDDILNVTIEDSFHIDNTNDDFSVFFWFKTNSLSSGSIYRIFSWQEDGGTRPATWVSFIDMNSDSNLDLRGFIADDSNNRRREYVDDVTSYLDNSWHSIAIVWDGSADDVHIYIDGINQTTTVTASDTVGALMTAGMSGEDWHISGEITECERTGNCYAFDGDLDEFRWYNTTLSSIAVSKRHNDTSNVILGAKNSKVTIYDAAINSVDGKTFSNSIIFSNTPDLEVKYNGTTSNASAQIFVNSTPYGWNYTIYNNSWANITVNASLPDGYLESYVEVNDSDGETSDTATSSNFSFRVETEAPNVDLSKPDNDTYTSNQTYIFNFTAVDEVNNSMLAELFIDGVLNQSNSSVLDNVLTDFYVEGLSEGNHSWYVNVTDDSGTNKSDVRTLIIDVTSPVWILDSGNSTYQNSNFYVNWSLTELYPDYSTDVYSNDSWVTNYTNFVGSSDVFVNVSEWGESVFSILVGISDLAGNFGFSSVNVTIDTLVPTFYNISSTPNNNTILTQDYIYVNYSANDTNFNSSNVIIEWVNTTGTFNYTVSCSYNSTDWICNYNVTNLGEELQKFRIYFIDKAENVVSEYRQNNIETKVPNFSGVTQDRAGNPDYREDVLCEATITSGYQVSKVILETNASGSAVNYTVIENAASSSYGASFTIEASNFSVNESYYWMFYFNNTVGWNVTTKQEYVARNLSYRIEYWDNGTFYENNATQPSFEWDITSNDGTFEPDGQNSTAPLFNFWGQTNDFLLNITMELSESAPTGVTYYFNTAYNTSSWTALSTSEQVIVSDLGYSSNQTVWVWLVLDDVAPGTVINEDLWHYSWEVT